VRRDAQEHVAADMPFDRSFNLTTFAIARRVSGYGNI
jgi:hypothetical protein